MVKGYVPIYFDWLDTTQDLTAEEKGNLIDAVVSYACGQEYEHFLQGASRIAFRFLQGQVDRNAAISEVRRAARQGKQATTNDNKTEQNASNPQNKNNNKNNNKNKKQDGVPPRRFTPPTVDEVATYCRERGNGIDPAHFVDYYTARGWMLTNGRQVRDWKACMRTWERNNINGKSKTDARDIHGYDQRDYSGEQEKAIERLMAMADNDW